MKAKKRWIIYSSAGVDMGIFDGDTPADAIAAMNRDDYDDGLTVVPAKAEIVRIAQSRDAEGRAIYAYARYHERARYWIQPLSFPCYSRAAAIALARDHGFRVHRGSTLQF